MQMKKFFEEFKKFISRGNVMEMDRAMELARQAVLDGAGQKVIENA